MPGAKPRLPARLSKPQPRSAWLPLVSWRACPARPSGPVQGEGQGDEGSHTHLYSSARKMSRLCSSSKRAGGFQRRKQPKTRLAGEAKNLREPKH